MLKKDFSTVDEYIDSFPENIRRILEKIRETIKKAAPDAKEVISYRMPAFRLNGILVYFAAQQNHIGFYPTSKPIEVFRKQLARYQTSKGAVRFPFNKPIPFNLISKITKFRVKEDLNSHKNKAPKKFPEKRRK